MSKKLYVGNLSYDVDQETLVELFSAYGTVESVNLITDRATGQSKGFGFVEMSDEGEANAAIAGLNETDQMGRPIKVAEASPPKVRPQRKNTGRGGYGRGGGSGHGGPRGSGGGGYGGGGGGGGYGGGPRRTR